MIKSSHEIPGYEKTFIRQALAEAGLRLDGRGVDDFRDVSINLSRTETSSRSEVQIGNTLVIAVVTGEIVSPYPDRPIEGILQFNAEVSSLADIKAYSHNDLIRVLERSIKESESIDTESLCIISGEKVWQITCEIKVMDASGGNILDPCILAAMSALRSFRKPETSVVTAVDPSDGVDASISRGPSFAFVPSSTIVAHHSHDREPLPLALHHTPLSVTLGVFKFVSASDGADSSSGNDRIVLLSDPTVSEENAMDGKVMFSINGHKELCAITKPGGVSLSIATIVKASKIANVRAQVLHNTLQAALSKLEERMVVEREKKVEDLRQLNFKLTPAAGIGKGTGNTQDSAVEDAGGLLAEAVGIDRHDPILVWGNLHQAAVLREDD